MPTNLATRRRRPVRTRLALGIMAVSIVVGVGTASVSGVAAGVQAATATVSALTALAALRRRDDMHRSSDEADT
jgi:hypothetical protein